MYPWPPYGWQVPYSSLFFNAHTTVFIHLLYSYCWCLEDRHDISLCLLLQDILVTWSSSFSSSCNLESNIWFKNFLWKNPTNITQYNH
jgi:hypothetical protein